jgi:hypothetical protein
MWAYRLALPVPLCHRGIILSWADYGGHQHINKRHPGYIIDLFTLLGCEGRPWTHTFAHEPLLNSPFVQQYAHKSVGSRQTRIPL